MRPEGACGDRGREIWPMIQTSLKPGLARLRELSPLECTDTKNAPASPLECTDTNSLDLKSFRFHCYKKRGVGGCLSLPASPPAAVPRMPIAALRACSSGCLHRSRREQFSSCCQVRAEPFRC